ncbi:TIM barrel protein [Aurantibacter crassamenti]|uniref:sugar phosphate isomerase/epimerase family protein n=1 Tax=Aurantibacter crassamenti TaxID=1837375 RepID=UPI00193AB016|nr:TIM barrel protein [Aurantibacter crassamenti]MBM1104536.1 TIM barrel protein [Aurantibacter crassamenti]
MRNSILQNKLVFIFLIAILNIVQSQDQNLVFGQQERLQQYAGNWVSTVHADTDSIAATPQIRMSCIPKLDQKSLVVDVKQYDEKEEVYKSILVEMISHDVKSDSIRAYGQNKAGELFIGKGYFNTNNKWEMQDYDFYGNKTMRVTFDFLSFTEVLLEGFDNANKSLWKTRYIKQNPKDKNIGIQLVSVHKDMQNAPKETIKQLGRMGYSFVETFVYSNGGFYDMQPTEFRKVVEQSGMQFLGSMTFYDLPKKSDWSTAMNWWQKCIEDHKKAGILYLSTSNNQIKKIKTKEELQKYCDYYNAIGKLCKENGLKFIFHNHADEFLTIDGVRVYDYFLEHINPEYVFFQSDLYWMHVGGVNPIDYFKKHPQRFISWHVKDYKELGQSGKIDFKEIFKYSEQAGLQYNVGEVEAYSYPPLYSVGLAWEYMYNELLK